jgi:hypothetical protein
MSHKRVSRYVPPDEDVFIFYYERFEPTLSEIERNRPKVNKFLEVEARLGDYVEIVKDMTRIQVEDCIIFIVVYYF